MIEMGLRTILHISNTNTKCLCSTLVPGIYDCDFENGLCTWYQDAQDNFNWRRQQGSAATPGTGPPVDHTRGSEYGMYILRHKFQWQKLFICYFILFYKPIPRFMSSELF